jgi:hypothetical protein
MSYESLCSAHNPNRNLERKIDSDSLSVFEKQRRDELITDGINECHSLIKKQKSPDMFYFYEGSIEGFQECKTYSRLSQFTNRLDELNKEELQEISGSLKDPELREMSGVYDPNKKMDLKEVWKIKGKRTQVDFVYQRLLAFKLIRSYVNTKF